MTREEAVRTLEVATVLLDSIPEADWYVIAASEACKMGAKAIRELDAQEEQKQKLLTIDELRQMDDPVWCLCEPIEGGNGFWCLCENGKIITPAGTCFYVSEIPNWMFLRCKPKEEHHAE